jgi:uncharacterized membrane protein YhhN
MGTIRMRTNRIVTILFWVVAISYGLFINLENTWLNASIKALPASLLFIWLLSHSDKKSRFVPLIFLACAIGDTLLAIPFKHHFVAGLSAFLVAHLILLVALLPHRKFAPKLAIPISILASLIAVSAVFILNKSGALFWPVLAYICVIACMALMAILASHKSSLLLVGALIFTISDLLIGLNRFVVEIPYQHQLIMMTYYTAIYCLTIGLIKGKLIANTD